MPRAIPRLRLVLAGGLAAAAVSASALGSAPGAFASDGPAAPTPASVRPSTGADGLTDLLLLARQLPVVGGTPGVGSLLDLSRPVWNLPGVTTTVQWVRDGVPIPGASGWSYLPTADDAGHVVQAVVTGKVLGLLPVDLITSALPIPALGGGGVTTLLSALQPPSLAGPGGGLGGVEVGAVLRLLDPVWSLPGVSTAYQWFVDGSAVLGATGATFVPPLEAAGKQVYALVTGTLAGLPVVSTLTDTVTLPALPGARAVQATSAPTLSDPVKVGTVVTTTAPTWDQPGTSTTYQWLRDGAPIDGATGRAYTPTPTDLGRRLSVLATGSADGYAPSTVESTNPATVQLGDAPRATRQPRIDGTARRGSTLTGDAGAWGSGEPPTFGYVWTRGGTPIEGATSPTYAVGTADLGRPVALRVSVTRTGHRTATFTTSSLTVARAASRTLVRIVRTQAGSRRAVLAVRLRADGVRPSGVVRLYDGQRRIGSVRIAGSKRVTLPRLRAGAHRVRAVYVGSTPVRGSASPSVRLVVD